MGRIIAGQAKGMRIDAPKGDATRPTTDRVKEALFSSLATWFDAVDADPAEQLAEVAVLDLFAGSGGLGLEAASRGAAPVVAVDSRTASLIRDNARRTGLGVDARSGRAETALSTLTTPFDLVFVDPPYDLPQEALDRLLGALVESAALRPRALVVVERSRRSDAPGWPESFAETWERRYGETTLHFGAMPDEEDR